MEDSTTPPALKRCSKCGLEHPATTEFYPPAKRGKYGVGAECRRCKNTRQLNSNRERGVKSKARIIIDGKQRCTTCGQWKPATPEFFARSKSLPLGIRASCKACEGVIQRARRQSNPEKRRDSIARYYRSHRGQILARGREYNALHPEKRREQSQRRLEKDPETVRRNNREKTRKYRKIHGDAIKARARADWQNNPAMRLRVARYHARKRALPDTFTEMDWEKCLNYFNQCCAYCEKQRDFWHTLAADHFIPLASAECLGTVPKNIVPACKYCNSSKNASEPIKWLNWKFGKRRAREILKRIQAYFDSLD